MPGADNKTVVCWEISHNVLCGIPSCRLFRGVPVAEYSMPQFVQADLYPLWLRVLSHRHPRVKENPSAALGLGESSPMIPFRPVVVEIVSEGLSVEAEVQAESLESEIAGVSDRAAGVGPELSFPASLQIPDAQ